MKQKVLIVGLPLVIALASASADAATRYFQHSGVQCQQADHLVNNIDRTQFGIHNTSFTDGLTVECPVNVSYPGFLNNTVASFSLQAYDRSPTADISCDLQKTDGNGNVSYTVNLHTTGSPTGVQGLSVTPSGVIQEAPWRLRCWLPPSVSSSAYNHLVNYSIGLNQP